MAYYANYERGYGILRLTAEETNLVKKTLGAEPFTGNVGFTLKGDLAPFFCEIKRTDNGYLFYDSNGKGQLRVNPFHIKGLGVNNAHQIIKVKNLEVIVEGDHIFVLEKEAAKQVAKEEALIDDTVIEETIKVEIMQEENEAPEKVNLPVPQRFLNIDMGTLKNMINGILEYQNIELLDVSIQDGRIASLKIKREETY